MSSNFSLAFPFFAFISVARWGGKNCLPHFQSKGNRSSNFGVIKARGEMHWLLSGTDLPFPQHCCNATPLTIPTIQSFLLKTFSERATEGNERVISNHEKCKYSVKMWRIQKPSRHAEGKWITQKQTKSSVNLPILLTGFLGEREIWYHPFILIIHNTPTPPWGKRARTMTSCIWWQRTGNALRHSLVCTKASSGQVTEITDQEQPRRHSLTF